MPTVYPANINHRRIVDFSPEVAKVCLVNIRPPKNDVVMSETRLGPLGATDVIGDKPSAFTPHKKLTKVPLKVPATWCACKSKKPYISIPFQS